MKGKDLYKKILQASSVSKVNSINHAGSSRKSSE